MYAQAENFFKSRSILLCDSLPESLCDIIQIFQLIIAPINSE